MEKEQGTIKRAGQVLASLKARYPDPRTTLSWSSPWELLAATILSAQSTDDQVNRVTPELFHRWPTAAKLASAGEAEVAQVIRPIGLFRTKARSLVQAARAVSEAFQGQVPQSLQELISLPGVGRKTANIILSNAFGRHEGIAVDTHVKRLAFRLGLTQSDRPDRVERDLMQLIPREDWGRLNHLMVWFGRDTCRARSPLCLSCPLSDICPRAGLPPLLSMQGQTG